MTLKRPRGPIRTYTLPLYSNAGKAEDARYAIWWATRWCLDYVRELYADTPNADRSTAGRGDLCHSALKRARDILRRGRASSLATGVAFACPRTVPLAADAIVRASTMSGTFPFWVKVSCGPYIPTGTHRALSRALRNGAVLRPTCELRHGNNGGLVARVFVEYPRAIATPKRDVIGADVGINHGVTTSDGRCGRSLHPILQQHRERNAERRRQGHRTAGARTAVKQQLDREARRLVTLARRGCKSIAIEQLRVLGNLQPSGSIGGWARRHFGDRVRQIAEEVGDVAVVEVHPAYTSQTCPRCDHGDRLNRSGVAFQCVRCGYVAHADVVGARNVARKARGTFPWERAKAARQTRSFTAARRVTSGGAS